MSFPSDLTLVGLAPGPGLAWVRERGEHRLEALAQVLESGREREALAEMLGRFVGREAGAECGDLEEDAARLAEVDRAEVEAVDDGRRRRARLQRPRPPCLVVVHRRGPGDVVDGACAPEPALGRRRVVEVAATPLLAARLPLVPAARFEAQPVLEERAAPLGRARVGAHAVEALQR